jgi:predicted NBD/HSP70 family sugar kinase
MTISTGIGGGIVAGGRLLQGRQGLAGHLGFMAVEPDGKACGSGRSGTLESMSGGRALEEAAAPAFGRPIGGAELFALDGRDERATGIIDAAARTTARALASLVSLIDPDRIVIGGGIGLATGYLGRLRRGLEAEPALFRAPLVAAALGADAGLVGAASWVEEEHG